MRNLRALLVRHRLAAMWLVVVGVAACADPVFGPLGLVPSGGATEGDAASGTAGAAGAATGLPCEVAQLLEAHCLDCHAAPSDTPPLLDTREELMAPSASDPTRTVAELSLDTMRGIGSPMPPSGLLSNAAIAPFAAWLTQGMPAGDCNGGEPPPAAPVCSTDTYWTDGDKGSAQMYPGRACNACHVAKSKGPVYLVAGTVYPTAHEPDDCYGTLTDLLGASVEITDANGSVQSLAIKTAGSFSKKGELGSIVFPITARVVAGGKSLEMQAPIDEAGGDCNVCHTSTGAGAPGRIVLPM